MSRTSSYDKPSCSSFSFSKAIDDLDAATIDSVTGFLETESEMQTKLELQQRAKQ